MRYVIIGTGGASVSAVEAIREYDLNSEIIMISNENVPPYSACLLTYYLIDEKQRDMVFWKGKDFYDRMGVTPVLGKDVTAILPENKTIMVGNERIDYDKLLIAAGGRADLPPVEGLDKKGVFTFKTLPDTDNIFNWLKTQKVKNAVVLGGGFIGLDAAEGLKKNNVNVTVVELLDRLLPYMLDKEMSAFVEEILQKNGVNVMLENTITEILGPERVEKTKLADETVLNADIVIVATGVKPNLDVVKDSGIKTNSGIVVNEYLETNMPDVYAAGDIVESLNIMTRKREPILLWPSALLQGTIAGYNMVGKTTKYFGSDTQTLIKIYETPVISDGIYEGEEIKLFEDEVYKKMYLKNSIVVGYMLINTMQNAGVYHSLMISKRDISDYKRLILTDKFNIGMIIMEAALAQEIV
ncbi:MAG: NAD(P)/FAD-dependent oxidoreductase [Promethearchaeota archaeon]